MTSHGENIGSPKVEPAMNGLPKWQLKANYVMRELARAWYGKMHPYHARRYPKSEEFERAILDILWHFLEENGVPGSHAMAKLGSAKREFKDIHGREVEFDSVNAKFEWIFKATIPERLYKEFTQNELIQDIFRTAIWLISYDVDDLDPPYPPEDWLKPLDYYEALPVLEPTPYWELLANALLRDLAYVWYDDKPYEPERLFAKLKEVFFAYGEYVGISEGELISRIEWAKEKFWEKFGFEITFRTPVQEIVWMDKVCLSEQGKECFSEKPLIDFILRALELLHILSNAGVPRPYRRYLICFEPLRFYDNIQLPETEYLQFNFTSLSFYCKKELPKTE